MNKLDAINLTRYFQSLYRGFPHKIFHMKNKKLGHHVCIEKPQGNNPFSRITAVLDYKEPDNPDETALEVGYQGVISGAVMLHVHKHDLLDLIESSESLSRWSPLKDFTDLYGLETSKPDVELLDAVEDLDLKIPLDMFFRNFTPLQAYLDEDSILAPAHCKWWGIMQEILQVNRNVSSIFDATDGGSFTLFKSHGALISDTQVVCRFYENAEGSYGHDVLIPPSVIFEVIPNNLANRSRKSVQGHKSKLRIPLDDEDFQSKLQEMFRLVCRTNWGV